MPFKNSFATIKAILKVYHDFKPRIVPPISDEHFRHLNLILTRRGEPYRPLFDEEKLRGDVGIRELWSVDSRLD
jgi:hypothetical protein